MTERSVLVRLRANVSEYNRAMASAATSTKAFVKDLDSSNDRMTNIIQTSLALGPALVPISAAAVPAVAGLTLQLGLAAAAAGTAVLAFQGVGTALKALDTFQASPTAANFEKLNLAMEKIGPAGQEFVFAIDELQPKLRQLQEAAAGGLLPGAAVGLEELLTVLPRLRELVFTISSTMGDMAADTGRALAGPEVQGFFDYIDVTARPVLIEMGQTIGNFTLGIFEMLQALDPLTRSFSTGFRDMAESFKEWAQGLDQTQGFQDFVNYIEESGPAAVDALGSLANAIIQIVEAAAPVGQHLLPVISVLADTLGAIADSPAGPLLISAAVGIGAIGRSLAILRTVGLRGGDEGIIGRAIGVKEIKSSLPTLKEVGTTFAYAGQAAKEASDSTLKARASVHGFAGAIAPAALAVGGLALATSGLADKTGLSNTASLALMGTIAGPVGVAIGGAIGLYQDFAAANDDLEASIKSATRAFAASAVDIGAQQQQIDGMRQGLDAYWDVQINSVSDFIRVGKMGISELLTNAGDEGRQAATDFEYTQDSIIHNLNVLSDALNGPDNNPRLLDMTTEQMTRFATDIAPAAEAAGLNLRDILSTGVGLPELEQAARKWNEQQKNSVTDSKSVADAMDYLGGTVVPALTSATDLNSDGIVDNTDAILANIEAQKKRTDANIAAFDAETAYQRSLNEGKDRDKEKSDIEQQIADAKAAGAKERADLRESQGQNASDAQRQIADMRRQLAAAKTPAQRASLVGRIEDAQRGLGRDAADAQERIAQSFKDQAKQVADLREKLAEYANTLDKTTVAGQKNRDLLSDMASKFNGLSDKAKNAKGRYEEASKALFDQAKQFGASDELAQHFVDTLLQIPPRVQAKIILEKQAAQRALDRFSKAFDGLDGKVAKAFIRVQQDHITGPGGKLDRAGRENFAAGDVRNAHQPMIAAGSPVHRVWAEEETQGESYIPHANDWRRPRALDIWEQTGRILGVQFRQFAAGSTLAAPSYAAPTYVSQGGGLSSGDIGRLASALAAARPLYGDVLMQPHDYNQFRREMDADRRAAAGGSESFT